MKNDVNTAIETVEALAFLDGAMEEWKYIPTSLNILEKNIYAIIHNTWVDLNDIQGQHEWDLGKGV